MNMDEALDPFEKLPDEVFQLIFHAIGDCKSLLRCMVVSRVFREHSERVSSLSIVCPGHFSTYVEKLQHIFAMLRRFRSLEELVVRVGQPKDEPPSWARCMRYAEIGSSVEKFVFMAAKTGEFSDFDLALRGIRVARKEKKESSSESEAEDRVRVQQSQPVQAQEQLNLSPGEASSSGKPASESSSRVFPEFSLRQVVAPSNDVLKRMVPVIVFAIVQGLDEFRDSVPAFIHKFQKLRTFLLVDMLESVTVFMREHQIEQIRSRQQHQQEQVNPGEVLGAGACRRVENESAEMERSEMATHDEPRGGEDRKGKGLEADEGSSSSSSPDRRSKGKEVDTSGGGEEQGESSSIRDGNEDGDGEEDVSSTPRSEGGEGAARNEVDDSPETWKNCRGICIHGPGDSRGEFVPKYSYKRLGNGSTSRPIRLSSKRRERNPDWLQETVRRRQEYRVQRGLGLRRREDTRSFRTWRLGKRGNRGGNGDEEGDEGGYTARSMMGRRGDEAEDQEASSSSFSFVSVSDHHPLMQQQEHQETSPREQRISAPGTELVDSPQMPAESSSLDNSQQMPVEENSQPHFDPLQQQQQQHERRVRSEVRRSSREGWRNAWRERWGERTGRRWREMRENEEFERRERVREGVRRRQMEMEREALRFDITFWRAEEVVAALGWRRRRRREGGGEDEGEGEREVEGEGELYKLTDVSMCVATHCARALSASNVERVSGAALAGPLLAATIALVNQQAHFHNL